MSKERLKFISDNIELHNNASIKNVTNIDFQNESLKWSPDILKASSFITNSISLGDKKITAFNTNISRNVLSQIINLKQFSLMNHWLFNKDKLQVDKINFFQKGSIYHNNNLVLRNIYNFDFTIKNPLEIHGNLKAKNNLNYICEKINHPLILLNNKKDSNYSGLLFQKYFIGTKEKQFICSDDNTFFNAKYGNLNLNNLKVNNIQSSLIDINTKDSININTSKIEINTPHFITKKLFTKSLNTDYISCRDLYTKYLLASSLSTNSFLLSNSNNLSINNNNLLQIDRTPLLCNCKKGGFPFLGGIVNNFTCFKNNVHIPNLFCNELNLPRFTLSDKVEIYTPLHTFHLKENHNKSLKTNGIVYCDTVWSIHDELLRINEQSVVDLSNVEEMIEKIECINYYDKKTRQDNLELIFNRKIVHKEKVFNLHHQALKNISQRLESLKGDFENEEKIKKQFYLEKQDEFILKNYIEKLMFLNRISFDRIKTIKTYYDEIEKKEQEEKEIAERNKKKKKKKKKKKRKKVILP